jgi:hypothetical protein
MVPLAGKTASKKAVVQLQYLRKAPAVPAPDKRAIRPIISLSYIILPLIQRNENKFPPLEIFGAAWSA